MSVPATYLKTPKGIDEIKTRKNKLSVRQRNLLILIDGSKPLSVLNDISLKMGLSPGDLAQLENDGFIAPVAQTMTSLAVPEHLASATGAVPHASMATGDEAEKFRIAHKFMNDTVANSLGLKAFFFILKLERCATRADLSALLGDYSKALTKATGPTEAEVMVDHVRELLQ